MMYQSFSKRQMLAMTWWNRPNLGSLDAIICDGAVRSGKTVCMVVGFFLWSMARFDGKVFALCGKTIGALRRNVLAELVPRLKELGAELTERRSENKLTVRFGGRSNDFYLFGGRDEAAAGMIQGMTLAGVLMDEVALMPRSFVEQACARCSVTGSKLWFNCNPAGPNHWFYREWILGAKERNALHLHFTMEDNPSLSPEIRQRYERLYTGIFYRRFVLGQWAQAEGRVYDFFEPEMVAQVPQGSFESWYVSCDYGTVNPMSMGLWGLQRGVWYRVEEFYFDSRAKKRQMTDGEYEQALQALAAGRPIREVIVDPSAASFLQLLRQKGWHVRKANNDVLSGIRATADALKAGRIRICAPCRDCLRELEEYVWDLRSGQRDQVKKEHDHAMDDMRYFVSTVLTGPQTGFSVGSVARRR